MSIIYQAPDTPLIRKRGLMRVKDWWWLCEREGRCDCCGELRRVAYDEVDGITVSTVLLRTHNNHLAKGLRLSGIPADAYETLILGGGGREGGSTWTTREDAKVGHDEIVSSLRESKGDSR